MLDALKKLFSGGSAPPAAPRSPPATAPAPDGEAYKRQGNAFFESGKFRDAEECYRAAIAVDPRLAAAHFNLGLVLRAQGRLTQARQALAQAAAVEPEMADAFHMLGQLAIDEGDFAAAIDNLRRAVKADARLDAARIDLCRVLYQTGNVEEARTLMEDGIALQPRQADFHHFLGNIHAGENATEAALASYAQALAIVPQYAEVRHNMGVALRTAGRGREALEEFNRALALKPDYVEAMLNAAGVLAGLHRPAEALAMYDRALHHKPDLAQAHDGRGVMLAQLQRLPEALAAHALAVKHQPDFAQAHSNIGMVLAALGRHAEALASHDRAIALQPQFADAHRNRGLALVALGRHQEAMPSFERLMELAPGHDYGAGFVLGMRMRICDWEGMEASVADVRAAVRAGRRAIVPFGFLGVSGSAAEQLQCSRAYAEDKFPPAAVPLYSGERRAHARIRVAYLSADFHEHATAYLMAGLFELHDRDRFETYAISFGPRAQDGMRSRLQGAFHRFIDVRDSTDAEIARLLHELEIDIAVDLKGFTTDSRTGIFAHRAAPLQVNYLGYPGSVGAGFMDYIVADARIIPPSHDVHYAEQVVRLPASYQPNDSKRAIAPAVAPREALQLPARGFVFCSFNNNYKITPEVFDVWMRLLGRVEGSVLWLLGDNDDAMRNLRKEAARRGIDTQRLVFAPRMELPEHLARHAHADLFLDTLPCNAHTTASDALWAGLPVLTCTADSFASRVASSLLHAVGLDELVAADLQAYEVLALRLATDPQELARLREGLQSRRAQAPLFDTARHCRHLEAAYAEMWKRHERGEAPGSFDVRPVG